MAPYRAAAASGIVAPSLAAVGSAIAAAWHPWIAIAIAVLLVVQYLDIVSGTRAAEVRGAFRRSGGDGRWRTRCSATPSSWAACSSTWC